MIIVGAGMAGLLAGAILRDKAEKIVESQPALPNNHSAVLRFRTRHVADAVNIPFREVNVMKAVKPYDNPISDALLYSLKTNGTATIRSSVSATGEISKRFIAPQDFISQLANKVSCPIEFNYHITKAETQPPTPVISTIPMPSLMKMLGWEPRSQFRWRDGVNVIVKLRNVEAFCSLYVPDPKRPYSRISITGDELVAECYDVNLDDINKYEVAERAMLDCGIPEHFFVSFEKKPQRYGKILPIDEDERKQFIMWASQTHGIYSLGRFATWRPGLLLDDVVDDIRIIQKLITQKGETYAHKLRF